MRWEAILSFLRGASCSWSLFGDCNFVFVRLVYAHYGLELWVKVIQLRLSLDFALSHRCHPVRYHRRCLLMMHAVILSGRWYSPSIVISDPGFLAFSILDLCLNEFYSPFLLSSQIVGRLDRHRVLPVFLLLINLALHRLLFLIASTVTTALIRMLTTTLRTVKFERIVEIRHDLVKVSPLG